MGFGNSQFTILSFTMTDRPAFAQLCTGIACIFLGLALTGVNYCQKSYSFLDQVTVVETGTPTATGTITTTPDSLTATPSRTAISGTQTVVVGSPSPAASISASPTATVAVGAAVLPSASAEKSLGLKSALMELEKAGSSQPDLANGDWLGKAGEKSQEQDTDGDGFTDSYEVNHGSDPADQLSMPSLAGLSRLVDRFRGSDEDLDRLTNNEEIQLGTSANLADSDGDGISDGLEVLGGSDPLDQNSKFVDKDRDNLPDSIENQFGSSDKFVDTDGDGLSDDLEFIFKTNPAIQDSDRDGIYDGREIRVGSDPTIADR